MGRAPALFAFPCISQGVTKQSLVWVFLCLCMWQIKHPEWMSCRCWSPFQMAHFYWERHFLKLMSWFCFDWMQDIFIPLESQKLRVLFESRGKGGRRPWWVVGYCFVFQFRLKEECIAVSTHRSFMAVMVLLQPAVADSSKNDGLSHCEIGVFLSRKRKKTVPYPFP